MVGSAKQFAGSAPTTPHGWIQLAPRSLDPQCSPSKPCTMTFACGSSSLEVTSVRTLSEDLGVLDMRFGVSSSHDLPLFLLE